MASRHHIKPDSGALRGALRATALCAALSCAQLTTLAERSWAQEPSTRVTQELSPRYPKEAVRAAVTGEVLLELVVDEQGAVSEVKLKRVTPEGFGFEREAVEAISTLLFEPFVVEGIPVRMNVTYLYRFTDEALRGAILAEAPKGERVVTQAELLREQRGLTMYGAGPLATDVIGLSIHKRTEVEAAATSEPSSASLPPVEGPTGTLEGVIYERGTTRPLPGAEVALEGFGLSVVSDQNGRFALSGVPVGSIYVLVKREGYRGLAEEVQATEGVQLTRFYMQTSSFAERELAGDHIPAREITRYHLSQDELRSLAGVDSDPLVAARELAGAYRPPFDSATTSASGAGRGLDHQGLGIRGTQGGATYLLGSPLITPYRLGGYRSLIPSSLLGEVSLKPQYGFEVGRSGAGLYTLSPSANLSERLSGEVELTPYDLGLTLGGPVARHFTLTGAVRGQVMRAALELGDAQRALSFGPQHSNGADAHLRLSYRAGLDNVDVMASSYGDGWSAPNVDPTPTQPSARGGGGMSQAGAHIHGQWKHRNPSARLTNTLTASAATLTQRDERLIDERFEHERVRLHLQDQLKLRLNAPLWLEAGLEQFAEWSELTQRGAVAPVDGLGRAVPRSPRALSSQHTVLTYNPALWAALEGRWMRTHFKLGARANYFSDTEQLTPEPRLTLRYMPAFGTLLKLGGGLYTKRINPLALDPMIGAEGLKHERHAYVSGGLEQRFTRELWLDVEGFYRSFMDRLRPDLDPTVRLRSDGTGYSVGAEMTLKYDPVGRFYGWAAYTFAYSRLQDGPEASLRRSDIDQSSKLSVLGGFKLSPDVTLHSRFRYWRGGAYSNLPSAQLFDSDRAQLSFSQDPSRDYANELRLSDGHQLDLRLDMWWRFDQWRLLSYLQVSNLYQRANQELPHPLADLNPNAPELLSSWPLWLSAGLRARF